MLKSATASKALFLCYQRSHQTTSEYLQAFKARVDVCKSTGGRIPGNIHALAKTIVAAENFKYKSGTYAAKMAEFDAIASK